MNCSGLPTPTGGLTNGSAFQAPSGVFVDACLVFKAGWTDWSQLFMRATGAAGNRNGHWPYAYSPLVPRFTPHPSSCHTFRFIIVRNPYERVLSYYLDKVLASCNSQNVPKCSKSGYWPRGLPLNASFGDTVRAIALPNAKPLSHLSELHYEPIATSYSRCVKDGNFHILKLEAMDAWYAPLVLELGLAAAVARGWRTPGGCFYVPAHATGCETALDVLPPSSSSRDRLVQHRGGGSSGGATSSGGTEHAHNSSSSHAHTAQHQLGHSKGAREKMARYYTPEIAKVVSEHWRVDLEAFGYPVWDGDPQKPWV